MQGFHDSIVTSALWNVMPPSLVNRFLCVPNYTPSHSTGLQL